MAEAGDSVGVKDRAGFTAELHGQADRYWHAHPFHLRWHRGELTQREVQLWVANRWYYQKSLPIKDAAILANCPDVGVRRRWLQRIVFQDGTGKDDGGLADWLRLCDAVGLSRDEVLREKLVVPGVRFATDAYVNFARSRPWVEAVASSLTELFSPELMQERVRAIEQHYPWVGSDGLAYFASRSDAARRDADFALDVVVEQCRSRDQQEAAIAALVFKCDVLWSMLDSIERASADQ